MDNQSSTDSPQSVSTARKPIDWEGHEYLHIEKNQDWFWALGLIAVAGAVGALLFNNVLFAIFILIAAFVVSLLANRKPNLVRFSLTQRGVRIDDTLYPFGNLKSFAIAERSPNHTPKLILEPHATFSMHIIIPLENVDVDHIHDFLLDFLPEDDHIEPFSHHVMEWFGF
jgi:hypothetical protein